MFRRFIERPVLSTVISIIIVMLGILGLVNLPIAQYPDISPPTIQVSAAYPGANAEVMLNSVIIPLEEQINGVEGMTYMTSNATNEGMGNISVYFDVGADPDQAVVDVQNRVSTASSLLPAEVTQAGVTVRKQQTSMLMISAIYSDNPAYDEIFLQNYVDINLIPRLKRVKGIGNASSFGSMLYALRIWLKPDVMAVYGLIPEDISSALREQNIEAAPGKFGEQGDQSFQYVIRYTGKLKSVADFENIILKSGTDGQLLRLKDVARIELGAQSYNSRMQINGKTATNVAIRQAPGSNARELITECIDIIEDASQSFPPGVHLAHVMNINRFLDASIHKIVTTFIEAFLLVFLVVFIFLQDFRATLIPAISVPVAIIGTFFFLYLFGFSINLLTLFALILAIGIVVDDAIVVVEVVHTKLEQGYHSPIKAAVDAMAEITGAIISITLVMASVFVPVTFVPGSSGVFFRQFGVTLAVAIIISAVNALTLSPALSALFLKPRGEAHEKKRFFGKPYAIFNAGFKSVSDFYVRSVAFFSAKKWLIILAVLLFGGGLYTLMKTTSSGFVPEEDMGTVFVNVSLPPAASMERTTEVADKLQDIARTVPGINNVLQMVGRNMMAGNGSSYAMIVLALKHWSERKGTSNRDIIAEFMRKASSVRDATIIPFPLPTITGFGMTGGFSFELQDKGGHTINEFYRVAQTFLSALRERPEIQFAATPFDPNFPQYLMEVNVPKIKEAGLTVDGIMYAMQAYYGGVYAANFNQFGKQYRIMIQAEPEYRANIQSMNSIYVRNKNKEMAPISEFITLSRVYGPESISRFNLFTSISITGSLGKGYSSGQALSAIESIATQTLPPGYGYEFSGISREEEKSGSQAVYVFILSLLFVYFLLSALYESYILPFAVILSLPVGLTGTFVFVRIFGIDNNIYTQISLIMLIGLLAKNAILIVEFALERRLRGMSIVEAAVEGARARLRPILMTSFAFIFGVMPLMLATGAGANGNRSIGISAVGGMLFGTLIGIFAIPILFILFQMLQEKLSRGKYGRDGAIGTPMITDR